MVCLQLVGVPISFNHDFRRSSLLIDAVNCVAHVYILVVAVVKDVNVSIHAPVREHS
jgi:hypothetical protein